MKTFLTICCWTEIIPITLSRLKSYSEIDVENEFPTVESSDIHKTGESELSKPKSVMQVVLKSRCQHCVPDELKARKECVPFSFLR